MKRMYAAVVVMVMLLQSIVVSAQGITNIQLTFSDSRITVTAEVNTTGKSYAMTVVREGGSSKNPSDVFAVREAKSDAGQKVTFTFVMPDERNGEKTDGKYVIYLKGNNTPQVSHRFDYATAEGKAEAVAAVAAAGSASVLTEIFDAGSKYRAALVVAGFVFDEFDRFSAAEKNEVCRLMFENMGEKTLSADFAFAVILAKINLSENTKEWLLKTELMFEDKTFAQSQAQAFIANLIRSNRIYNTYGDFNKMYELANILFLCNNAKYNTIEALLAKYAEALVLTNDSNYQAYKALTGNKLQGANESIVTQLSKSNAVSGQDIIAAIKKGVSDASNADAGTNRNGKQTGGDSITIGKTTQVGATQEAGPEPVKGFTDLNSVPWAQSAIITLYDKGIISGISEGIFDPEGLITREAFVKMIVAGMNWHDPGAVSNYEDVQSGAWYESYVASAAGKGIISGIGENLFGVGENIVRQDVAVIIENCLKITHETAEFTFADDSEISGYAKAAVYKLYAAKIISGMGNNQFVPKGNCTRAQAAVLIYNMMNYNPDEGRVPEETEPEETSNQESPYASQISVLSAFGFLKGISADNFNESNYMIRQKFISSVAAMASAEPMTDAQALEYAKTIGLIIEKDYDAGANISYDEAAAMLVNLLGYNSLYPDKEVLSIASEIGLLRYTTGAKGKAATAGSLIQMLYNAIEIPLITVAGAVGGNIKVSLSKDDTILSVYHKVYEVKGIVTQNENTSLTGKSTVGKGGIELDGVHYLAGNSRAEDFLGMNTRAYVYRNDNATDENRIIYIEAYKNIVTEISSSLLDYADLSSKTISYFPSQQASNSKRIKFIPAVKVIYNGRVYADYTEADLNIKSGRLRLVDYNSDGTAEVIFIEEYTYMIVDSVSTINQTVYNFYAEPGSLKLEDDDTISIYLNGEKATESQLNHGQILSVLISKDVSERIIKIEASDKAIEGVYSRIDLEDKEIVIDGKNYPLSKAYLDARAAGDPKCIPLYTGNQYTYYLDSLGGVAYIDQNSLSGYQYAYIKKFQYDEGDLENTLALRYMTIKGVWVSTKLAEKTKYKQINKPYTREEIYNKMGGNTAFQEELVRIKLNSAGEISVIEEAEERAAYQDNMFNKRTTTTELQWGVNNFSFDSKVFTFTDTVVLRVPKEPSINESDYAVTTRSFFVVDAKYEFTAYDLDEFNYTPLMVVKRGASIAAGTQPFIVAKVEWRDVDGEVLPALVGIIGENTEYTVIGESEDTFKGVSKGDIIQLGVNVSGRAYAYNMLYSVGNSYGAKMNPDVINVSNTSVAGFVTRVDRAGDRIQIDNGMTGGLTLLKDSAARIGLYDMTKGTVEEISINEIEKGDYLFARLGWSRVKVILIVRKNEDIAI